MKVKCCLVFDIGKTNQKYFLFDKNYKILKRDKVTIPKIKDEDGHIAENIQGIVEWMRLRFNDLLQSKRFEIEKVNFSAFGATLVNLDQNGEVVTPVYDYHKSIKEDILVSFYENYGPEIVFATRTGSKNLKMLNSGKQLYWLKFAKPEFYKKIKYSLHLPQYLSYVFTGEMFAEFTSIGCHTDLWDYEKKDYHHWVTAEGIDSLFPSIVKTNKMVTKDYGGRNISFGIGIHDSSSALLTYLLKGKESFILLSTGTWCINFNPFSKGLLFNEKQIESGVTAYMKIDGTPVITSRLFLGEEHRIQVQNLVNHFGVSKFYYRNLEFDRVIFDQKVKKSTTHFKWKYLDKTTAPKQDVLDFPSFEIGYHQLIKELIDLLNDQIRIICDTLPKKIYVDGGFSDNDIFIKMLEKQFPNQKIKANPASFACALGAAMLISD